ncbi:MAG TPA: GNAT family N-acetyltransferase [Actinophytocola sp.]|uniref:GNAT family N-acetyltransferase n=1 Tax=Actinophytocola sp. TaxID=1872138 RepID=UPI002DBBFFD4|nr:GNAT family N-acetyltransferase [Actinophytocola sp.]HEU5475482.1 GNAT family N-acetyltransferase [Actinophytocola sp.]
MELGPREATGRRLERGLAAPAGRWAIHRNTDDRVIGGALLLPLPPGHEDPEIGWQLHPDTWGNGYASETTHALATWAFTQHVNELFAVVRPGNTRTAWQGQLQASRASDYRAGFGFKLRRDSLIPRSGEGVNTSNFFLDYIESILILSTLIAWRATPLVAL